MKIAKLVIGIISIILFALVIFQSCAAGLSNTLSENEEVGGSAGVILAICLLIAGIIGIATRNSSSKGAAITVGCFYGIGGLLGLLMAGSYTDLYIWSAISIAFGLVFIISIFTQKKDNSEV